MSEKLMPCPFCGGEAIMKIQRHIPKGYEYTPTCKNTSCAGRLTKKWLTETEAIEAWNRRVATDKNVGDKERTAKVKKLGILGLADSSYGTCENCWGDVLDRYTYCPHCGARLEWK